jgi:predicted amidohydrolase
VLPRVRTWQEEIGRELRSIYVEYERRRLAEIIRVCAGWGVSLLVFPEYSVPVECIESLLPLTRQMTVVLGSHAVEPDLHDAGFYSRFGVPAPPCGSSAAPVAINGALHSFHAKLNPSRYEREMTPATAWAPVTLTHPVDTTLGILLCLDYLHRDGDPYRAHVDGRIDECRILAVPSLTPYHTRSEFTARSVAEAQRYGRAVLYANDADGGETSIYVDSDLGRQDVDFPFGIPRLGPNEEGIVVADIDCDYVGTGERAARRYSSRTAIVPIAASVIRYASVREHVEIGAELAAIFQACDPTRRTTLTSAVAANTERLVALAARTSKTLRKRLNILLDRYRQAREPEHLLRLLRDIELPEEVLPPTLVDRLRLKAASALALRKTRETEPSLDEEDAMLQLRRRLIAEMGGTP